MAIGLLRHILLGSVFAWCSSALCVNLEMRIESTKKSMVDLFIYETNKDRINRKLLKQSTQPPVFNNSVKNCIWRMLTTPVAGEQSASRTSPMTRSEARELLLTKGLTFNDVIRSKDTHKAFTASKIFAIYNLTILALDLAIGERKLDTILELVADETGETGDAGEMAAPAID